MLAHDVTRPILRRYGEMEVRFEPLDAFARGSKSGPAGGSQ